MRTILIILFTLLTNNYLFPQSYYVDGSYKSFALSPDQKHIIGIENIDDYYTINKINFVENKIIELAKIPKSIKIEDDDYDLYSTICENNKYFVFYTQKGEYDQYAANQIAIYDMVNNWFLPRIDVYSKINHEIFKYITFIRFVYFNDNKYVVFGTRNNTYYYEIYERKIRKFRSFGDYALSGYNYDTQELVFSPTEKKRIDEIYLKPDSLLVFNLNDSTTNKIKHLRDHNLFSVIDHSTQYRWFDIEDLYDIKIDPADKRLVYSITNDHKWLIGKFALDRKIKVIKVDK